jgi:hypothetical protein
MQRCGRPVRLDIAAQLGEGIRVMRDVHISLHPHLKYWKYKGDYSN